MKYALPLVLAAAFAPAAASAQAVSIGGEGRMGILAINPVGGIAYVLENRLKLTFNVAVEADHGLTFGAFTQAQAFGLATGVFAGSRVYVEANGLNLTFGNADGAIATAGTAMGYVGGCMVGYIGGWLCADTANLINIAQQESGVGAAPAQRVVASYTMGETVVALSHDRGGDTEFGARTAFDAFTVAAGYSTNLDTWTVSGHYNAGAWGAGVIVSNSTGLGTSWTVSANTTISGISAYAFYGEEAGAEAYGVNFGYDLGGGATLSVGYETVGFNHAGSVGIAFSF